MRIYGVNEDQSQRVGPHVGVEISGLGPRIVSPPASPQTSTIGVPSLLQAQPF